MSIRRISHLIIIASVSFLFSCGSEKLIEAPKERIFEGFDVSLDSVIRTPQGIIRGLELGAKLANVKSTEKSAPVEFDVNSYYYEYKIDSLTFYSVAYSFVKDSLDEIEIQINSRSLDEGMVILNDLKKYYQEKYTSPAMDQGIYVFNCFDSRKRNFNISLTDNSGMDNASISLLVYREK